MESKKFFPIFEKNFRPRKPDPLTEIQMTLERSQQEQQHRSKRMKCLLGKKETPGLTQMVLDAGQKVIGPVHCDECGLLYSPGDIEDEKEHRKAHSRLDNLFSVRLWKNANVVQDYPVEACMIVEVDCQTETKRVLNCLQDFLEWLDSELGGANDGSARKPSEKIYLYLFRTKRKNVFRVLGCVIVEPIELDTIICKPLNPERKENQNNRPILFGLTRLWTDSAFRRRHVAFKLCDAVRTNSKIPGFVVPRNQLGILEPSEDGQAFMARYTDGQGWLYTYKSL